MSAQPRIRVKARSRPLPTVVPFVPWEATPNPKTISLLRELLERAESGDVQAVAVVCVHSNRNTGTGHAGGWETSLLGATIYLQHELAKAP